jgi:hypothetical protein
MNKLVRSFFCALALGGALTLAACGGGGGDSSTGDKPFGSDGTTSSGGTTGTTSGTTGSTSTTPPPPVAGVSSLVLTLTDPTTGATTTAVPAVARAIVRDASGVAVPNTVVTFNTNTALAAIVPASGTALTDTTGTATVRLNAASLAAAGASTVTATSQVGSEAVTGSIGFSIGAANVTITNFTFGTNPLSAFGTTSVSVTVNSNGTPVTTPQTVTFSSPCSGSNKAVLTASVVTGAGGVATASYRDNGCGGNDLVTASVSGLATSSSTLAIAVPSAGSIQFVSATPTNITLKGTGGPGRQESSQVVFKVVDTGGNPLSASQTVNFSLSTSVGGITFSNGLTTSSATSDPSTGQAVVTVQAGTVSTPVRVLASTTGAGGVALSTQSDQLSITTGIPDQASFSLSATKLNIEGGDIDGTTTVITARLADHFSNPVPDGTAVSFISEGGSIGNNGLGSCTTVSGSCSATLTSQALRPTTGRVTVLAYAVGEESFTDLDGDGLADKVNALNGTTELIDANGVSTDMPEAFLDSNENGTRDANETFIDFNANGQYDTPDSKYNGVLCNEAAPGTSSAGTCGTQKSIHVFRNLPIVFSGSNASVTFYDSTLTLIDPTTGITFTACNPAAVFTPEQRTVFITVTDTKGNVMPAGTTVAFSTNNGTIVSTPTSFTVPNTSACLSGTTACAPGAASAVAVGATPLTYEVIIKTQATQSGVAAPFTCTVPAASPGRLSVTVTTPSAVVTTRSMSVTI